MIGLAKIERLDLLNKVFSKIFIPEEVFIEVAEKGAGKPGSNEVKTSTWIEITPIEDKAEVDLLTVHFDRGEAELLVLAKELRADLVLIDEEKARKSAIIAGFSVMGLLGLFILAKRIGIIDRIQPMINELRRKKFRLSDGLVTEALKRAGELN